VITNATVYANEESSYAISQFGAIRSKLAEMATSCYAGESATYRLQKY
jgi:alkylation response protein AidB-like acyl-CoA dehydrogenase